MAATLDDPPMTAALRAMHADPARQWTVATLVAEAGVPGRGQAVEVVGHMTTAEVRSMMWWGSAVANGRQTAGPAAARWALPDRIFHLLWLWTVRTTEDSTTIRLSWSEYMATLR